MKANGRGLAERTPEVAAIGTDMQPRCWAKGIGRSACRQGADEMTPRKHYAQLYPCLANGRERTRVPVAAKMAFATAGRIGGSEGSPKPVGGLSLLLKCTSIAGGACVRRTS